jgi:di/tricarboxylate transporter
MDSARALKERELADLRVRYAAYLRSAKRTRLLIVLSGTIFIFCLVWIAERFVVGDKAAAVFLVGLGLALFVARWLAAPKLRWKEIFLSAVLGRDAEHSAGSTSGQARLIEDEIALLEEELKALSNQ